MKIAVIGTGYVGLVSGTCLAETGNYVTCVDIDINKVQKLQSGIVTIYEPGLENIFQRNIKEGRLTFTTQIEEAIKDATLIFLALPTPPNEDGSADLSYVLGVADQLGKIITDYKVIINKSTVPVGTADRVKAAVAKNATCDFDVISNPEFLREGVAVDDFLKPDRVVVGTSSARAKKLMEELYKPYVRQGNPIIFMDERSAELTKYAANSYLATRISFMNELALLAEKLGANIDNVRIGMGSDNRIGRRFLFPGIGYGGSCFPKDVQALAKTAKENEYDFKILNAVMNVNHIQKHVLSEKILNYFGTDLSGITIGIWGLAFKPNTDDIREAPALYIIQELLDAGAKILAYDPEASANVQQYFSKLDENQKSRLIFVQNSWEAIENADVLAILTEWAEFRGADLKEIKAKLKQPIIFDGRNIYDLEAVEEVGFYYNSIGRKTINKI
ncbi:MAG TPA: UDP-glucose/GDP-mannose dehydrogenase family protein [Chitinophagales bacterium]|nr:UDP-glucose/GDP-mannose dehydrogenase family protein [Chitinophagales bacterium]HMU99189.1 UDP-glucose/GDP-mannose dehydrogenase family protein [Chitinophagales bacterium]HMV03322.1 UDP-glucose/GDP-mannose dehydrogenase family protein [Chitinophagales bacterium]HMW95167.1 UDP-glucose/GDP-mannose dehydrogenase family protein [Chitinophagales bacterium]HMY43525.1 UDP-glucose/GDP-mannose dehydrogenase family protein [Chitinophagales bacterium]